MPKAKVLIVDDEYGIRAGVREVLSFEGYTVIEAETAQQGMEQIETGNFDIALIDYRLPDQDGLTLLRNIQAHSPSIMTCMVTAYANIETAVAATRQGVDLFLPKPFSPEDLIAVIETLMRHKAFRIEAEQLREAHRLSLRELAGERNQTRSLVSSLRDAVLVVNRESRIALGNRAAAAILAHDEADLIGRPVAEVLEMPELEPVRLLVGKTDSDTSVAQIQIDDRDFMASVSPFFSDDGILLGQIITLADISEVRRMAMEKAKFIRTMIHEVRSPLGAIRAQIELLLDGTFGEERKPYIPYLERAQARIDGLSRTIGDLLTLARTEIGPQTNIENTELFQIIAEVMNTYRERAQLRQIETIISPAPTKLLVQMPAEDLRTVIQNLYTNAIKYNRNKGSIAVSAFSRANQIVVEVRDTGVGIKKENLPRIFEEFWREKRSETREAEGNGIGLAIVKRLVERYRGHISVESVEGQGTKFTLVLNAPQKEDPLRTS